MFGFCKSDSSIPIEQLDYKYIGSCKDTDKLQKILKILRSGEEGIYPDLIKFAEEHLQKHKPNSTLLEKKNSEKTTRDLHVDERQSLIDNLKGFVTSTTGIKNGHGSDDDDTLPPIRSTKSLNVDKKIVKDAKPEKTQPKSNKRVTPRSYDEWSKLDKEIDNQDDENDTKENTTRINHKEKGSLKADEMVEDSVNSKMKGVSDEELRIQAENEKNKGNEAFRAGDFKEALVYYNRSLNLKPITAVHNNRAMTYIKLENYVEAIKDSNAVLKEEPDNIKAYLRRGLANQSLQKLELALQDFTKVIEIEPKNKRGKELYETVYKELEKKKETGSKKGKRLIVEELSSEETNGITASGNSTTTEFLKANVGKKGNRLVIEEVDGAAQPAKQNVTPKPEKVEIVDKEPVNSIAIEKKVELSSEATLGGKKEPATQVLPYIPVQKELPQESILSKNDGNEFYKNGQYNEAYQCYTFAIQSLMGDSSSYRAALSSLFNNRAICQLKSGKCNECIRDCNKSLQYAPNIKAILRRATSYETLEKFKDAYVDYQLAFSRDRNQGTSQAMSRISRILKADCGKDWHDQLPKSQDLDWNNTSHTQTHVVVQKDESLVSKVEKKAKQQSVDKTANKPQPVNVKEEKPTKKVEVIKTKQEQFLETKEQGNSCVKQGKYSEAVPFYTECIMLLPSEVPSYTNRALCYLKLKQPKVKEAIEDCTSALTLQPGNVKALFRRAQGLKILKKYKDALGDLATILKAEPKNTAAQKDMDECKNLFRTELREIQLKNKAKESSTTKGKKMKIEEVTSESINKPSKQSTKVTTCPMAKNGNNNASSKQTSTNSKKINGFEFMQMWNAIKSAKSADYAEILRQIEPQKLPELLTNKIDGKILENFIRAVHDFFTSKEHYRYGMSLLKHMQRVQRFSTNLMFLGTQEKTLLKTIIDVLENRVKQDGGERSLQSEISQLRTHYRCPSS